MISYFVLGDTIYAVSHTSALSEETCERLSWLFGGAQLAPESHLEGTYVGPRPTQVTPWSTNAVEITQNMRIAGIDRIEQLTRTHEAKPHYDPMLQAIYKGLGQESFAMTAEPQPIREITDLEAYNEEEGLALSEEEIAYLQSVSARIGRPLTDSEVFGFSQVNSEHCRHKIFNGTFVIDGLRQNDSLFAMIKQTSKENPNCIVSAYKDNVAFVKGPRVWQFAPTSATEPSLFTLRERNTVLALKAETHNFPTTVEPFNGAATGSGGEIRDRMCGGKGSLPLSGSAVYITSYPRLEKDQKLSPAKLDPRPWLYQSPQEILTKASDGASDFGNKFGQPLINGSLLTFEHQEGADSTLYGYDKVIMLAGGMGYAPQEDAKKETPQPGETVVLLGGDNYRIGMGGGAVSSVATGEYSSGIELNAVQRANPEMQKRVLNVVRAISEQGDNPIVSIHDHGAGGHLNCLTELIEETGGRIDIDALPVGDPTLSAREIIGNESQERVGLLIQEREYAQIEQIARREGSPIYKVGETTDDERLLFSTEREGRAAIDLAVSDLLGQSPKTVMEDETVAHQFAPVSYDKEQWREYLDKVLTLEAVASKDWLTNKVDRSVTGRVAQQQCVGALQLPLSDLGAMALDYDGKSGMATAVGHAPQVALIDAGAGSRMAIAEALTNIVFAPIEGGIRGISLSANWMWPCRNKGEDARLYQAVQACSEFAIDLGINIPTGKDSLSMTQKYPDGKQVMSPGTLIITAAAPVSNVRGIVTPELKAVKQSRLLYIDFSFAPMALGGSALAQALGQLGDSFPTVGDTDYFATAFEAVQVLIHKGLVLAGHDISAGGMVTTLLEMCFANTQGGAEISLDELSNVDLVTALYSENPGVILQVSKAEQAKRILEEYEIAYADLGAPTESRLLMIHQEGKTYEIDIDAARKCWANKSYLLDCFQSGEALAASRYENLGKQPIQWRFPHAFAGTYAGLGLEPHRTKASGIKAAILRDNGTNGEREMAYALHLAGFDVEDIHLTDLIEGRTDLSDIRMLVYCGGFSHSDVLGSAKGWAAGILYNERARKAIEAFYARPDTLSLGICNGCQLMAQLGLLGKDAQGESLFKLEHNASHKFESNFLTVDIADTGAILTQGLEGCQLGVWVAHGEGRFVCPTIPDEQIAARYHYDTYPGNPNGSERGIAALCSSDGRHLAMMPHPERATLIWQCGFYPEERRQEDQVSPWVQFFRNGYEWLAKQ